MRLSWEVGRLSEFCESKSGAVFEGSSVAGLYCDEQRRRNHGSSALSDERSWQSACHESVTRRLPQATRTPVRLASAGIGTRTMPC